LDFPFQTNADDGGIKPFQLPPTYIARRKTQTGGTPFRLLYLHILSRGER